MEPTPPKRGFDLTPTLGVVFGLPTILSGGLEVFYGSFLLQIAPLVGFVFLLIGFPVVVAGYVLIRAGFTSPRE